ncbi:response regulator transcription factor [Polycladidibacter hongkongensis]|uniref:response regulator transcription factor n=1 Tax=Polycladidibacter hongkongensis TaxID=1647556 RepID=UPI00082C3899|nr:response regulator transcription factor [Pseudovibrio hongkongensis]
MSTHCEIETLLIVEDDALHREFLRKTLQESDLQIGQILEASDGEQGTRLSQDYRPDAAILDLQVPKKTGVDIAKTIWNRRAHTPIMFWSNYSDEAYVRGITRVAPPKANYGYLLKTTAKDRLERAIIGIFRDGQNIIDREISGIKQRSENKFSALSDKEYEILVDIALGLTDGGIAARRGISVRSVQARLQNLYAKLGICEVPKLKDGVGAYNRRNRAVAVALMSRQLNGKTLEMAEKELHHHLNLEDDT